MGGRKGQATTGVAGVDEAFQESWTAILEKGDRAWLCGLVKESRTLTNQPPHPWADGPGLHGHAAGGGASSI